MSTVKYATEIRREQIAQAALELIAAEGMKSFNIARLAQRVGFAPSAMYHHFKGKDEILDSVLDLLQNRLRENADTVRLKTRDPIKQLNLLLTAHTQLILGFSALPRILFSEDVYGANSTRKARLNRIIMNYPAITVHEKSTFSEISGLMAEKVISRVPVTDNGSSARLWRPIGCRVRDALNSDALRNNLHLWHDRSCFSIEAFDLCQ